MTRGETSARPVVTIGIPTRNRSAWLKEAVESALAQTFSDFRLLICDNASDDDTPDVVAAFGDGRIDYQRSEVDLGMVDNFNRVISSTSTRYLVILPDDDLLYPDYLRSSLAAMDRLGTVGVVHSAFDLIDQDSKVLSRGHTLVETTGDVSFESGADLIDRAMYRSGIVCWASALFRTAVVAEAGGLRAKDEPFADGPLMMRIALRHDFAALAEALVAVRVHETTVSAADATFTGSAYDTGDHVPGVLFRQRIAFLDEAGFPAATDRRYRGVALRAFHSETVGRLTAGLGVVRNRRQTVARLWKLVKGDRGFLFVPATLKLGAALVAGRSIDDPFDRARPSGRRQ